MSSIFLSYNHADKKFVQRLAGDLRGYGVRVWEDEAELRVGRSLIEEISKGIEQMEYLGVVLSPSSINSQWVQNEVKQALTEEIRTKRIKVLPILLADCKIPLFLADKLYADFRVDLDYEASLNLLIRSINDEFATLDDLEKAKSRMRADREQNQEVADFLDTVEALPLTRGWRIALKTGVFSKKFSKIVLDNLVRMRGMTFDLRDMRDWEYPMLAASILAFFRELRRIEVSSEECLRLCCGIVDAADIESKWRKEALGTFLQLIDTLDGSSRKVISLPIFFQSGDTDDNLLRDLITGTASPGEDDSKILLFRLWEKGPSEYRTALSEGLTRIALSEQAQEETHENLRKKLTLATDTGSFREALDDLWQIANEDLLHRETLRKLMSPRVLAKEADVLPAFRAASLRAATGQLNALTNEALQMLSAERVQVMRHQYDRAFVYRLLARVALDSEVHPLLSSLAMGRIGESEDLEALLMEDDVPAGFLIERVGGSQPPVIDFLCNGVKVSGSNQLSYIYLLEIVHMGLEGETDDGAEKRFFETINRYSKECPSLKAYLEYLQGRVPFETLEESFDEDTEV